MSPITHSVFKRAAENLDKRVHMDSPAMVHSGRDVKRAFGNALRLPENRRFVFFLLIITGDCHLLIADNVVLPAFCAKTYRLRSTIDVQNGVSKVSVGPSLALLISREALAATVKYFMGILTEVSTSVRCSFGDHT